MPPPSTQGKISIIKAHPPKKCFSEKMLPQVVMQRLSWFFLHRVRYLFLVCSKHKGREKCKVIERLKGKLYTKVHVTKENIKSFLRYVFSPLMFKKYLIRVLARIHGHRMLLELPVWSSLQLLNTAGLCRYHFHSINVCMDGPGLWYDGEKLGKDCWKRIELMGSRWLSLPPQTQLTSPSLLEHLI